MTTYVAAAAPAAAAVVGLTAPGAGATRLDMFMHDTSEGFAVVGPKGPSTGDLFSFHGKVFTHKGGTRLGRYGGTCTTLGRGKDLTCGATSVLRDGQIVVDGMRSGAGYSTGKTVSLASP